MQTYSYPVNIFLDRIVKALSHLWTSPKKLHMEQKTTSQSGFADACSSPLLVVIHGESKIKYQTIYSLQNKRLHLLSIRELQNDCYCLPIAQGGLVLFDPDSNNRFLFNLATMKKVQSSPVTDQNCVVLCTCFWL